MKTLIEHISNTTIYSFIIQTIGWLVLFLAPIKISMYVVIFLIVSDLIFGTWASIGHKNEPFSSRALRRTLGKIFIYEFLVVFAWVLQKNVWPDQALVKGCMTLVSVVESISILENIKTITGIDIWAFVFHTVNRNSESGKFLFKLKQKRRVKKKKKS